MFRAQPPRFPPPPNVVASYPMYLSPPAPRNQAGLSQLYRVKKGRHVQRRVAHGPFYGGIPRLFPITTLPPAPLRGYRRPISLYRRCRGVSWSGANLLFAPASTQSSGGWERRRGQQGADCRRGYDSGVALYQALQPSCRRALLWSRRAYGVSGRFPGGIVCAGGVWQLVVLPEGLILESTAHVAYWDGFPASFLQCSYGNWSVSAFSAHTGEIWSPPRARAQWQRAWNL